MPCKKITPSRTWKQRTEEAVLLYLLGHTWKEICGELKIDTSRSNLDMIKQKVERKLRTSKRSDFYKRIDSKTFK